MEIFKLTQFYSANKVYMEMDSGSDAYSKVPETCFLKLSHRKRHYKGNKHMETFLHIQIDSAQHQFKHSLSVSFHLTQAALYQRLPDSTQFFFFYLLRSTSDTSSPGK